MATRTIAIIGAGNVGTALATGLRNAGHQVRVGVRDTTSDKAAHVRSVLGDDAVLPLADATAGVDAIVLAVPSGALADVIAELSPPAGTPVIDATNAVGTPPPDGFATVGAYVASLVPGSPVVKAFNTIGAEHMATGRVGSTPAFLPVAGDDRARPLAIELARSVGFDVGDLGGPEAVDQVEAFARLWIHLAFARGWGRDFGFAVVGRSTAG